MINKLKIIFCFFVVLVSQNFHAQNEKEIVELLEKTNNYYSKSQQPLDFNYKLFSTYTSKLVTEEYNGFYVKKGVSNYIRIHNTEFLQEGSLGIKINHDQKMILIINSKEKSKTNTPLDISTYLKHFKTKILKTSGNNYTIILQTNVLTQLPYGKVIIEIDKTSFKIKKQILYFLDNVPYLEKGVKKNDTPRLEILINDKKISSEVIDEIFKTQNYNIKTKGEYTLSEKYSNYKLLKN